MKKIYVVILHYKDLASTKACITSIKTYEKNKNIIVVNNDDKALSSNDFPGTTIINNKKNLGFAAGVNVGMRYALKHGADAILLLNNDTFAIMPFIDNLLSVFKEDSSVGIVGPAIYFEKNGKHIYDIGGYINTWTGRTYHNEVDNTKGYTACVVPYITGAAMFIKKEVIEKIGFFDEKFFLYYEDVDFCLRAREKGFTTVVAPAVAISHKLSKTVGRLSSIALYQQIKSARFFGRKYFSLFPKNIFHTLFFFYQASVFIMKAPQSCLAIFQAIVS